MTVPDRFGAVATLDGTALSVPGHGPVRWHGGLSLDRAQALGQCTATPSSILSGKHPLVPEVQMP